MTVSAPYGDLTDAEWSLIEPLFPEPRGHDLRLVINGIFFLMRSGCPLRTTLPWSTAESYYAKWRADGTWDEIMTRLEHGRPNIRVLPNTPLPEDG